MKVIPKTAKEMLTFGLSVPEYACKCSYPECEVVFISERFLEAYKLFRYLVDTRLKIGSGHRCLRHNKVVGGVKFSYHLIGYAVDIDASALLQKFDIEEILGLAKKAGFTFVKHYKQLGFFHFDVREH